MTNFTSTFGDDDTGDYSSDDFFTGVASILEQTLERDPERQEQRLRLLEVYCATGRRDDFEKQAREYRRLIQDENDPGWLHIAAMAKTLGKPDDGFERLAADSAQQAQGGTFRRFGDDVDQSILTQLGHDYRKLRENQHFFREIDQRQVLFTGERPSPVYWANRLSAQSGGAQIHLKREGLRSLGAHKVLNATGQALVAKKLGYKRLVTGTVSGQGGVACAAAAAHMGLGCRVYMHAADRTRNQALAKRIELLGGQLKTVEGAGAAEAGKNSDNYLKHLNEVRNLALHDWLADPKHNLYVSGLAAGPDPYPTMQRDFLAIVGRETRQAMIETTGRLPDALVAPVKSDMDIISFFTPFLPYKSTRLVGTNCEEPRESRDARRDHDPYMKFYSNAQFDAAARILSTQGFPSTRREHQWLQGTGRVGYRHIDKSAAEAAARELSRNEGLMISLESAGALTHAMYLAARMNKEQHLVVLLADVGTVLATSPELAALDGSAWG